MSARSFRSVGWVAGVGAAALGCYMLSLQVAAERAELARMESRIVAARQAIRSLQTELGTRGRLQQLEHWNAEVLALSAPVAGQFVDNEVVLARLETPSGEFADGAQVRMASAEAPAAAPAGPAAPAVAPQVRQAVAAAPAAPGRAPAAPLVRRASLDSAVAPAAAATRRESRPAAARTTAPDRAAAPVRPASLLDERTARALGEAERRERRPEPTERRERAGREGGPQAD